MSELFKESLKKVKKETKFFISNYLDSLEAFEKLEKDIKELIKKFYNNEIEEGTISYDVIDVHCVQDFFIPNFVEMYAPNNISLLDDYSPLMIEYEEKTRYHICRLNTTSNELEYLILEFNNEL